MTYAYVDGDTVLPLTRILNVDEHLDYITNRRVDEAFDILRSLPITDPWTPISQQDFEAMLAAMAPPEAKSGRLVQGDTPT